MQQERSNRAEQIAVLSGEKLIENQFVCCLEARPLSAVWTSQSVQRAVSQSVHTTRPDLHCILPSRHVFLRGQDRLHHRQLAIPHLISLKTLQYQKLGLICLIAFLRCDDKPTSQCLQHLNNSQFYPKLSMAESLVLSESLVCFPWISSRPGYRTRRLVPMERECTTGCWTASRRR